LARLTKFYQVINISLGVGLPAVFLSLMPVDGGFSLSWLWSAENEEKLLQTAPTSTEHTSETQQYLSVPREEVNK
jgi:hypothetical protein